MNLASNSHKAGIFTETNRVFVGDDIVVIVNNASNNQTKQLLLTNGYILQIFMLIKVSYIK